METKELLDILFLFICSGMVITMNLGFALVESGLCQAKNTVNILAKNLIVFSLAVVGYYLIGYKLMYNVPIVTPSEKINFLFQTAFVATAATIVSGAVAERIKFGAFVLFSIILTSILYPVSGAWVWNGGWLAELGFTDFAGSTVVHSFGAFAALAGAIVLGKRRKGLDIPGHDMSLVTAGGLILYICWLGFNCGSELALTENIPHIAITTIGGGALGSIGAGLITWIRKSKVDLSMVINGMLAGLVSVTAGANVLGIKQAMLTGFIAGIVVYYSVKMFKFYRVDDPVGAVSVHGICGILGTLAVGLFGYSNLLTQIIGISAVNGFAFIASLVTWLVIKMLLGSIRVSPEDETLGLDLSEHGMRSYPDFVIDNVGIK